MAARTSADAASLQDDAAVALLPAALGYGKTPRHHWKGSLRFCATNPAFVNLGDRRVLKMCFIL
jgi:hypothetical protein